MATERAVARNNEVVDGQIPKRTDYMLDDLVSF
jgi:hypothetical protein